MGISNGASSNELRREIYMLIEVFEKKFKKKQEQIETERTVSLKKEQFVDISKE